MRKNILLTTLMTVCLFLTGCAESKPADIAVTSPRSMVQKAEVNKPAAAAKEALKQETKNITIASVGDIMMHMPQVKAGSLGNGKYDFSMMFRSIKPYIEKADFAVGNLETTLAGEDKKYTGYPRFNSPEILAKNIKDAGFDMVTTANNHSLDRNFYGVVKTIENLDKAGLLHVGTYKTKKDSEEVFVKDIKGIKTAFLCYTYATNGIEVKEKFAVNLIDREKMFQDIKKAKVLNVDMIIVSMHFGVEYKTVQNKTQEDLVNFLFKNGADVVLGSHPHVLQPLEVKRVKDIYGIEKDRFVIYSQGNIVSNMSGRYKNSGVVINLNIKKDKNGTNLEKVEYVPTFVDSYYNSKEKKVTYEILPIFNQEDYSQHQKRNLIIQSFNDSIKILKPTNPKIKLMTK